MPCIADYITLHITCKKSRDSAPWDQLDNDYFHYTEDDHTNEDSSKEEEEEEDEFTEKEEEEEDTAED